MKAASSSPENSLLGSSKMSAKAMACYDKNYSMLWLKSDSLKCSIYTSER